MLSMHRKKYEELERLRKRTNSLKFVEGLLVGTAMGLLAGLVLAPKPGRDTLDDIKDETMRLVEKGKGMMHGCCEEDEMEDDDMLPEPEAIEFDMEMEEE